MFKYTAHLSIYQMDKKSLYYSEKKVTTTVFDKIHDFISESRIITYNEISQEHLMSLKKSDEQETLCFNSLLILLNQQGIKCKRNELETYLGSQYVKRINPFEEYFESLSKWDGKNHIKHYLSHVKTDDDGYFEYQFKKWLVRTVKCSLEREYVNKNCIVLVQPEQNTGKTTFLRFLTPQKLKNYRSENISADKDGLIHICKSFITILDEIDKLSQTQINAYKSYFSKEDVNIRIPYGKVITLVYRVCSFIGSTNLVNFLKDDTGNVRWICFEVLGHINFNYSKDVNIDQLWAQAYHLAYVNKSYKYELTIEDVKRNEERNLKYKSLSIEEDLILELFEKSDKKTDFMTSTDVLNVIKEKHSSANNIVIGRKLNQLGFKRINSPNSGAKGYMIKRRVK